MLGSSHRGFSRSLATHTNEKHTQTKKSQEYKTTQATNNETQQNEQNNKHKTQKHKQKSIHSIVLVVLAFSAALLDQPRFDRPPFDWHATMSRVHRSTHPHATATASTQHKK